MNLKTIAVSALAVAVAAPAMLASQPASSETVQLELWSRQDPSGPLRAGNVVKAADRLNAALEAEGSDTRVEVVVRESPAGGFDDDSLQLLRVFGIGEGPDMFIAAHEWICAFQQEGFVLNLEELIAANGEHFDDIFPSLWESTKCLGERYGIPQDAEARMFFYNKKLMREAGLDEAFIEGLPDQVLAGEITMAGIAELAKQIVDNSGAEIGILHRPSVGPDYIMVFQSYGNTFNDEETGNLLLEEDKLTAAFGWFEWNVQNGVTPANNTAMEWGDIKASFYENDETAFFMYGIWDLGSAAFPTHGVPSDEEGFFKDWGWTASPPAEKGGSPGSLTHPIIYAVAADTEHPELAVRLLGFASDADLNTDHAVTTTHIGIKPEQLEDPRYQEAWTLARATEMLEFTKFLPNNPAFADLNRIIYTALQGVESGRLSAEDAALFVIDEAESQLEGVIVR
ncbi:MAG: ABC transporter substrate-binding protein [Alphaproteobacteria bacterium]